MSFPEIRMKKSFNVEKTEQGSDNTVMSGVRGRKLTEDIYIRQILSDTLVGS